MRKSYLYVFLLLLCGGVVWAILKNNASSGGSSLSEQRVSAKANGHAVVLSDVIETQPGQAVLEEDGSANASSDNVSSSSRMQEDGNRIQGGVEHVGNEIEPDIHTEGRYSSGSGEEASLNAGHRGGGGIGMPSTSRASGAISEHDEEQGAVELSGVTPEEARRIFDEIAAQNAETAKRMEIERQEAEGELENMPPKILVSRTLTVDEDGLAVLGFTIQVDAGDSAILSGVVLNQKIPPTWEIVDANPAVSSFNPMSGLAKWLIASKPLESGSITLYAQPSSDSAYVEDWGFASSWYTYRDDGQAFSFQTVTE